MAFAWVYPLVLGVGMYLAIRFVPSSIVPGLLPACVYATGVGLATARSIFLGVINIYGTTNRVMTIIYTILVSIVVSKLFIALGILIGSLVSERGTGGLGSIIVQLVCFTSGMYFSKDLVGKAFAKVCEVLPFESCLTIIKGVLNNKLSIITTRNIIVFSIYLIIVLVISVIVFKKKMVSDNK